MTDEPELPPADEGVSGEETKVPERRASNRRLWIIGGSVAGVVAVITVAVVATAAALNGGGTAEPEREPLVAPVALDVACEELIPDALVATTMAPDVSLLQDSGTAAWDFPPAYIRQAGGISCRWSNNVSSPDGREEITVKVLPHAPYEYRFFHQKMLDYGNVRFDLAGDGSDQQCVVFEGNEVGCNGELLVGHFWAHLELHHTGDPRLDDDEEAHAVFARLLSAVAEGLDGVSAPEPWVTPDWIASPVAICAAASAASGVDYEAPPSHDRNPEFPPGVSSVAGERQGIAGCPSPEGAGSFIIYPGSAWAWEEILSSGLRSGRPIEVAGADAAVTGSAFGHEFTFLSIGGSILAFYDSTSSPEDYARKVAASFPAAP